jgi:hypothetical protein
VSNFVDKTEQNLSALEGLLGTDNVEDMKKRIADLIVKRVERDINSYDYYLFYPSDYSESIDEAFETVNKKIVKMYKDTMLEVAQKAVDAFKEYSDNAITNSLTCAECYKCGNSSRARHSHCFAYDYSPILSVRR